VREAIRKLPELIDLLISSKVFGKTRVRYKGAEPVFEGGWTWNQIGFGVLVHPLSGDFG
jgi:hypothetical protein